MTSIRKLFSLCSNMRSAVILAAVLLIVFVSYLPVLKAEFLLWDDNVHIFDNITIRSLDQEHLRDIFTTTVNKIYIPLTSLSFAIEHHFFGYDPFIYHLDNLLLHLGVTAFVFVLARQLGLSFVAAGAAALVFGIHPMRVESVAWATERKDVLYAFFYTAALMSYARYLEKKKLVLFVATTLLGVLSMLAKPMALSLPLILLLMDWFKGRASYRRQILEKIPLGLLIAALTWVTYAAHARVPGERIAQSLLIWPWTFTFYLRQFVFPFLSVPIYQLPEPVTLLNFEYGASLAVLLLTVFSVARFGKNRWFLFAVLFYFFSIFFLLRFDDLKDISIVADRFMYLPGLGFCLWAGMGLDYLWQKRKDPKWKVSWVVALGACVIGMGLMSLKTLRQCLVWRDTASLWQHQLKYFPDEEIALNNLAVLTEEQPESQDAEKIYKKALQLRSQGLEGELSETVKQAMDRVEHIIGLYKRAIRSNPNLEDPHNNLGDLYVKIGRIPEAVEAYKGALWINYKSREAYFGLGDLAAEAGDVDRAVYAYDQALRFYGDDGDVHIAAIEAYNKALKKKPNDERYLKARNDIVTRYAAMVNGSPPRAGAYFSLGFVYSGIGDLHWAVSAYQRALDINPRHSGALYNLGNIYKDQGDLKKAIAFYEKAIGSDPNMSDAYLNIGIIYGRQGKEAAAMEYYQKAIKADAKNAKAYFNAGFMEEQSGNLLKASELYAKSVEFDPENDKGFYNLGNVFVKLGRLEEARSSYLKAVEADPENMDALVNLSSLSFGMKDFSGALRYCDEAVLLGYDAPAEYLKALEPYRKRP